MEDKKVYITFVKIETPRGGDFYVALKSDKISRVEEIKKLGIEGCTKEEIMCKIQSIDKDAKIVGGIILAKNTDLQVGGVYKSNENDEVSVDDFMDLLDKKVEELKKSIKEEVKRKGR